MKKVNTNGSGFSENKSNFILANSNGLDGYKTSQFTAYCEVVSKVMEAWKETRI